MLILLYILSNERTLYFGLFSVTIVTMLEKLIFDILLTGEAWFWLSLLISGLIITTIRKRGKHYAPLLAFCTLILVIRAMPLFTPLIPEAARAAIAGFTQSKLFLLFTLSSMITLLSWSAYINCDERLPRWWLVCMLGINLSIAAGSAAIFALAVPLPAIAIQAGLLLQCITVVSIPVMLIILTRPIRGNWFLIASSFLLTAIGTMNLISGIVQIPAQFHILVALLEHIALSLAAFFPVIVSLLELAIHSREDTVIDDYVTNMKNSVRRFIPDEFLHHLSRESFTELQLGDHIKKDMTIFFSDIRAFTELSEQLTPEESFMFINSYLSRMVPLINSNKGFVDKYMGDGIMALFAENGGADDAVTAAVEMQTKISEYNGHRAKMGYRAIGLGVGIHTGTLMLGIVGIPDRMEGTVISDSVNLSSRLQSIAKAFNLAIVISEATFMNLSDPGKYKYRFIGKVRVKGKDAPVSVFEIFNGLPQELFDRKMRSNTFFEQGMLAYYQKDFSEGLFYFKRALESVPEDGAARFYLETCLRKTIIIKE